ncbi:helix-turn-helix- domain containing protein type [Ilyonectria robusta]
MSSLTLYDVSIVLLQRGMSTLANLLKKASEHADATSFPAAKLYEDMLPLSSQVQRASNTAKSSITRLTGVETEAWNDSEKTFDELIARCEKTVSLLKSVDAKQVEGRETAKVELSLGSAGTRQFTGKEYILTYVLPNFFFHLQTAYAILRMKGVPLGKGDFLGPFMELDA